MLYFCMKLSGIPRVNTFTITLNEEKTLIQYMHKEYVIDLIDNVNHKNDIYNYKLPINKLNVLTKLTNLWNQYEIYKEQLRNIESFAKDKFKIEFLEYKRIEKKKIGILEKIEKIENTNIKKNRKN